MYILVTARKGISSLQLSKEIGITQKSAWFMLHRLRDDVTTNGVESVFAVLQRGILGVYHHVTPKHLGRYAD